VAVEYGLDRQELMTVVGLGEAELRDPDGRVSATKMWNLWRAVLARIDDDAFGIHIGERATARNVGLLGYTMLFSGTLRRAALRLVRYSRILSESIQFRFVEGADRGELILENNPRFDALRHPVDARLAFVVALARDITGSELTPLTVGFPYPKPFGTAEQFRFFRCELEFDQPHAGLTLRREDLDRSVKGGDETLAGYLEELAEKLLDRLGASGSMADLVRRTLWAELSGGSPTVERTASLVGVSPRTLQRRLSEEGTSFATVLDGFRRDLATRLLQDRSLGVGEIAYLLGYADPSTFHRAFRRWTGRSPLQFRKAG
jgi:AraC-like DNA-binding protein